MSPYVIRFAIANAVLTILFAVVAAILNFDAGNSLAVGAALASSFFAAGAFARDHGRAPSKEEKGAFAWRALCASWLVSLVLLAVFLAALVPAGEAKALLRSLTSGAMLVFMALAVLIVSGIYYLGIRWAFGWYAGVVVAREG